MRIERGVIPPEPPGELDQVSLVLEDGHIEQEAIRLNGRRDHRQWSFVVIVSTPWKTGQLNRRIEYILQRRCRFTKVIRDRTQTCLQEMIPNALQHGLPDSRVGILLEICGHTPRRVIRIMVENFVRSDQATLGQKMKPEEFERFAMELRGRGLGLTAITADELLASFRPGYSFLVTAFLQEQSTKGYFV